MDGCSSSTIAWLPWWAKGAGSDKGAALRGLFYEFVVGELEDFMDLLTGRKWASNSIGGS